MAWTLEGHRARLQLAHWQGTLDLRRTADGLGQWQRDRRPAGAARLLAVDLAGQGAAPEDSYVRVGDLVATYPQTAERPMRVQIYWRVDPQRQSAADWLAIDVQVSVQTALLDVPTPLSVTTRIAAAEVCRWLDAGGGLLQAVPLKPGGTLPIEPAQGAGCLLFRPAGVDWSYAEMIHPADFQHDELADVSASTSIDALLADRELVLTHHLFPESLEKGVILRSRLRGALLPRARDQQLLAECYAAFRETPPPLTT